MNSVFFSAVCFGLFHCNFSQMFYAFSVGLIFGYIYLKTQKIHITMIIHMVINFFGGYFSAWLYDGFAFFNNDLSIFSSDVTGILINVYSIIIIVVCVLGFVFYLKKGRTYSCTPINNVPVKYAYINTGMILFFILCITESFFILLFY